MEGPDCPVSNSDFEFIEELTANNVNTTQKFRHFMWNLSFCIAKPMSLAAAAAAAA
jgi:hypothetical protein